MENRVRVTDWVAKVVSLIQILLTLGGRCRPFYKAHFSIMSPKFGVKHDTHVKNTAKYS